MVSELHVGRLSLALSLGATAADERSDRRYPYVFEPSGAEAGFRNALQTADSTATVMLIGQSSTPYSVVTREIVQRQLSLRGALIHDHPVDFEQVLAALHQQELKPEQVIQAGVPAHRAAGAFETAAAVPGKSWIDLSGWTAGE